jgi:hypothetical protein
MEGDVVYLKTRFYKIFQKHNLETVAELVELRSDWKLIYKRELGDDSAELISDFEEAKNIIRANAILKKLNLKIENLEAFLKEYLSFMEGEPDDPELQEICQDLEEARNIINLLET